MMAAWAAPWLCNTFCNKRKDLLYDPRSLWIPYPFFDLLLKWKCNQHSLFYKRPKYWISHSLVRCKNICILKMLFRLLWKSFTSMEEKDKEEWNKVEIYFHQSALCWQDICIRPKKYNVACNEDDQLHLSRNELQRLHFVCLLRRIC